MSCAWWWQEKNITLPFRLSLLPDRISGVALAALRIRSGHETSKIQRHGPQFHPFFLRLSSYAHRTRRILLATIHATGNLFTAIFINIVLIVS